MKCVGCGNELIDVYAARSVELEWDNDKWIEKNVFSSGVSCKHCSTELTDEQIEELGIHGY